MLYPFVHISASSLSPQTSFLLRRKHSWCNIPGLLKLLTVCVHSTARRRQSFKKKNYIKFKSFGCAMWHVGSPPALAAPSLSRWTAREVPMRCQSWSAGSNSAPFSATHLQPSSVLRTCVKMYRLILLVLYSLQWFGLSSNNFHWILLCCCTISLCWGIVKKQPWAGNSLVAQWLGTCLPMQGMEIRSLVWELRYHVPQGN